MRDKTRGFINSSLDNSTFYFYICTYIDIDPFIIPNINNLKEHIGFGMKNICNNKNTATFVIMNVLTPAHIYTVCMTGNRLLVAFSSFICMRYVTW